MTDRNVISNIVESLFEDWIDKNINFHPLAIENMRILEADALALLKEPEAVEPVLDSFLHKRCPSCCALLNGKFCHECGQELKLE